jgi:hypothetical protein
LQYTILVFSGCKANLQYLSIRYTERLVDAGVQPSPGSAGDSYDNALAETINGLYKAEVVHRRSWRALQEVELATLMGSLEQPPSVAQPAWVRVAGRSRGSLQSELGALRSRGVAPNSAVSNKPGAVQITHAKWLVWHGKGSKALERIKALDGRLLSREGYEFKTLWWNLNTISSYLKNNAHTLVNYGVRHRRGLPISSSIAESAVNQVVSYRMAKKRQMRWTDEGAHCMVQVRVAVLNGEFSRRRISALKIAFPGCGKCLGPSSAGGLSPTDGTDRAIMP